jgi:hypothetical protein
MTGNGTYWHHLARWRLEAVWSETLIPLNRINAGKGFWDGEPGGNRTRDHKLKRLVLYQLSYRPTAFQTQRRVA